MSVALPLERPPPSAGVPYSAGRRYKEGEGGGGSYKNQEQSKQGSFYKGWTRFAIGMAKFFVFFAC